MIAFVIYNTMQIVNTNFVPMEEFIDNYREIDTNPKEIIKYVQKQNFACSYKRISMMHGYITTCDPVQSSSIARFIDIIIFERDEDAIQCKLSFPMLDEYVLSELWPTN